MKCIYQILECGKCFAPMALRRWVRANFSLRKFDVARRTEGETLKESETFGGCKYKIGIIKDTTGSHRYYVSACRDEHVSYVLLDILSDDWVEAIRSSGCDAFLVWPSSDGSMVKAAFDMRLKMLEEDLGMLIFPKWKDCWLTEFKPRLRDWMVIHNVPHPKSWVFYNEDEAIEFCKKISLPIVVKTAIGASGNGVSIVRQRGELLSLARSFMRKGVKVRSFEPWDLQRGYLFLQEYLCGVKEWRMVRIGDSYFGYRKETGKNGKGSGSHKWSWLDPGKERLDMLRNVTEINGARSMAVDLFETADGRLLVNEYQTVFGCSTPAIQMKVDGVEGRYLYNDGQWLFETGSFCANHCCNLRVKELIRQLKLRNE